MRIEILILVFVLATTAAFQKTPRGDEKKRTSNQHQQGKPRMLGGLEVPPHRYPYHVVYISQLTDPQSGALITDRWTITSAQNAKELGANPTAVLGAHFPYHKGEATRQTIEIDKIIIHEKFKDAYNNDIALLRLKTAARLDRFVNTIMITPFNAPDFDGARLVMTTYAKSKSPDGRIRTSIHYSMLNGIPNYVCRRKWQSVNANNICLDTTAGRGACDDEYGAPLVDENSGVLVGLLTVYGGCQDPPFPDVFIRLSSYDKWIIKNTK